MLCFVMDRDRCCVVGVFQGSGLYVDGWTGAGFVLCECWWMESGRFCVVFCCAIFASFAVLRECCRGVVCGLMDWQRQGLFCVSVGAWKVEGVVSCFAVLNLSGLLGFGYVCVRVAEA